MSYGDEIIAGGHARSEHDKTGHLIRIVTKDGAPRYSDLWNGLPWFATRGTDEGNIRNLADGPHCRPYIEYPFTRGGGCRYSGWRVRDNVGAIVFSDSETWFARDCLGDSADKTVLVEPDIPEQSNPNKQWGRSKWQGLADLLAAAGWRVAQVGSGTTEPLRCVRLIETDSFRLGAAVLSAVRAAVLPEGGLHHAAGVLKIPAVVLFGGAVDENAMGYPWHENVVDRGTGSPCGKWEPCEHCAAIWERLTPQTVFDRFSQLTAKLFV